MNRSMLFPLTRRLRRGSAAIEFALWLPVLLAFLAAVVDWGYYMTQRVAVARAVMEGARGAASVFEGPTVIPEGARIKQRAEERTSTVLTAYGVSCALTSCLTAEYHQNGDAPPSGGATAWPFDGIIVRVSFAFVPLVGLIPTPGTITDQFLMATEQQRD